MPRLSDYVRDKQPQQQPQAEVAAPGGTGSRAASHAPAAAVALEAAVAAAAGPSAGPSAPAAPPAPWQPLHDRYVEQYRRRVRDRGARSYRHPDGSLRSEPPAQDVYSQANRVHWSELVDYCRTHGGDREYDTHGFSLRYGIGVPAEAHRRLLEALDLREELAPLPSPNELPYQGDPLADPSHPFNLEWRELAEQVFAAAPGSRRLASTT
ncbi:hypothetical protein PLESTB_000030600 [Pleodorina starrii]|uniref:Uncharacterized protein n=1 Tax=Pleodorina starrii TaxID=330485 RepID=A0A9W6EVW3_9CHLO|nr:hypothetical protein PLESTB_000030600 [Pleodorina starrii]